MRRLQDDRDDEPIGEMVKKRREELGVTQEFFAEALEQVSGTPVDRHRVSRWENGKRIPGPYWRSHISEVLDIDLAALERAARTTRVSRAKERKHLPWGKESAPAELA